MPKYEVMVQTDAGKFAIDVDVSEGTPEEEIRQRAIAEIDFSFPGAPRLRSEQVAVGEPISPVGLPQNRFFTGAPVAETPLGAFGQSAATELLRFGTGARTLAAKATGDLPSEQMATNIQKGLGQEQAARSSAFPVSSFLGTAAPYMAIPGAAVSTPARAAATGGTLGFAGSGGDPTQAMLGAAGGAGGAFLGRHIAKPFTPSPQAQTLMRQGIQPTVGQAMPDTMLGNVIRRTEEAAQSTPILGTGVIAAKRRAMQELNEVALDRSMPFGETVPKGIPVRDALNRIETRFAKGYDDIYKDRLFQMTDADSKAFRKAVEDPKILVPAEQRMQVLADVQKLLKTGLTEEGIAGEAVKFTQSKLRQQARAFSKSLDPAQREKGRLYSSAGKQLAQWIDTNLPEAQQAAAKELDRAYANYLRVERAASSLGAEEGLFSAAQLQNAVKALAGGTRKRQFAHGKALMQDLSEPAKTALGAKVPDSGTPERLLYNLVGGGLLGGASTLTGNPLMPIAIGAGMAGALRPAQRYMLGGYGMQGPAANMLSPFGARAGIPYMQNR